jgi:hypothetical protein
MPESMRKTILQEHLALVWQTTRWEEIKMNPTRKGTEEVTSDKQLATRWV